MVKSRLLTSLFLKFSGEKMRVTATRKNKREIRNRLSLRKFLRLLALFGLIK